MKKLFTAAIGIMVILGMTLAIPVMAAPNPNSQKPEVSVPHYDVNFITGTVDATADPIYQIQVAPSGDTTITVAGGGGAFGISGSTITLQTGKTYEVYAQIRSKPGTSASWLGTNFEATKRKTDWVPIGIVGPGSYDFTNDITDNGFDDGCSNFATRWFEVD